MEKDHNNIDGVIREKLESLKPAIKSGSWEQLSQRMDIADQADAFDKKVGDRLEAIHVPYQASSWEILAERLSLERGRIQAVLHYKAMEVSLLLLLLMTAWQYFPITKKDIQKLPPSFPIASLDQQENKDEISETIHSIDVEPEQLATEEISSPSLAFHTGASTNSNQLIKLNSSLDQKSTSNGKIKIEQYRNDNPTATPLSPLPLADQLTLINEQDGHSILLELHAEKANNLNTPSDAFLQGGAITALDGRGLSLLDYGNPDELLEYIRPAERKTFLRIGFMGSPDYNRVITPTQRIEDGSEVSLDRYSISYSGGITLGVEHGKWEIETGAIYAARKYQAIPTVYISGNIRDGYSALSLKDFELNTIDIPLRFRYNFVLHDKWRMYGLAGVSLNVVLGANYYTVNQSAFSSLDPRQNPNGTSSAHRPQALENKQLTKGWIEGGSFLDNATPYANFGVGLERYMSYRWSVFAQPSYQHALPFFNDGLGPYKDKIHNFGINMGLKVRL